MTTEIIGFFSSETECKRVAVDFSIKNDIVNSPKWANCLIENGLDGAPAGHHPYPLSEDARQKISENSRKMWESPHKRDEIIRKQKQSWTTSRKEQQSDISSRLWTDERKLRHSALLSGRPGHKKCKGKPKHSNFSTILSNATMGVPKSEQHKRSMSKPKNRVCRLIDKKEMSINHYTRWINSLHLSQ